MGLLDNAILFPFRLTWNLVFIVLAFGLFIAWNVFVWGSVIVGVLLLIFAPVYLWFPLLLLGCCTELWPEY